jgi:cytochrome c
MLAQIGGDVQMNFGRKPPAVVPATRWARQALKGRISGIKPSRRYKLVVIKLIIASGLTCAMFVVMACSQKEQERMAAAMTGGEPARGKVAIKRYGCDGCHIIPGVHGWDGLIGPPLTQMAHRSYIAGVLPNTPDNMIRWIKHPPQVDHLTAMPDAGVTESDARDIAAYLYTLN